MRLRREERIAYLLIFPTFLYLSLFVFYSLGLACYLALTNSTVGRPGAFVGITNFTWLVQTRAFQTTLYNTALYVVITVLFKTVLGILLALGLHRATIFPRLIRVFILLPWVTPIALSTLAWKWIFDPRYSSLNWALRQMGIISQNIPWLSFPTYARIAIIIVNIWRGVPFFAFNILAGLKTIPQELYEAAEVDGAGALVKFVHITIPCIKPVLATVVLFSIIMTISDFSIVYVLTRGGPMDATHLLATLAYQTGLVAGFIGRGAAISFSLFPVLVAIVYLQLRLIRERWVW